MAVNLVFRRLQKGDKPMLSSLFKEVFGTEIDERYWDWKYFKNPAGEHMMYVAVEPASGRIVGEIGAIPVRVYINGRAVEANQVVDIVILPEYQKRGPFFQLEKLSREEIINRNMPLSYAVSIKRTYKISTKMLKFKGVYPINKMVKVLDPSPFLRKKIGFLGSIIGGVWKTALRMGYYLKRSSLSEGYIIEEVDEFDKRFDEFWKNESKNYGIIIARNSRYLNWRYLQNPLFNYKIFVILSEKNIKGFVVLSYEKEEWIKRGRIVDIFIEKDNIQAAVALINKAIGYFYKNNCAIVATWIPEHSWLFPVFKKFGFKSKETPHDLIIRSYDDKLQYDYLTDRKNWYLTMGDSDYF